MRFESISIRSFFKTNNNLTNKPIIILKLADPRTGAAPVQAAVRQAGRFCGLLAGA